MLCPFCQKEFEESEPWDGGSCPNCGKEYFWDEIETEDDWWPVIGWHDLES